jgi:NADPH-dependent glutamate synthase beta subunit-like oxidoreductase
MNIPVMIRQIQDGNVAAAAVTVRDALALPATLGRLCHHPCEQGCRRGSWDQPAGIRAMERFAADSDLAAAEPQLPSLKSPSGKSVVIIGAGPAGLAAAYDLLRAGHACTIADRNAIAGGTLRTKRISRRGSRCEVRLIERLGARFKLGAVLGRDITIEGLLRGFDAVLITVGEISKSDGEALGLEMAPGGIKINADTFETTRMRGVFAAGRAVKPVPHLVRVMADAQAAAECVRQFLAGKSFGARINRSRA